MRYLMLCLMFLTACESADHYSVKIGDTVTLQSGFYKGCMGQITNYDHYDAIADQITLMNVTCNNVTMNYLRTDARYLLN